MADFKEKFRNLLINYRQAPAMIWRRYNARLSHGLSTLKKHHASPPEALNFYPTDRCNLKCSMCFERLRKPRKEMRLADWQKTIDQVKKFRPRIHLSGGEPFVYPHIMELIDSIKKEKLFLAITTNGTFLNDHAARIIKSGVNRLHVSIDGPEKIHDQIRGIPGTFKKIITGLNTIKKLRGSRKLPVIRINSMLNLDNPAAMQEVINIACRIDADQVQFQHPLFVDKQSLSSHRFFLKKRLNLNLNYWQNANINITRPESFKKASVVIDNLKAELGVKVTVFPEIAKKDLKIYYCNDNLFYQTFHGRCRAMWSTATILPNGDIESCPDYIVGNCLKTSVLHSWNNAEMKKLRERIHKKHFFTVCRGCCFFYQ